MGPLSGDSLKRIGHLRFKIALITLVWICFGRLVGLKIGVNPTPAAATGKSG